MSTFARRKIVEPFFSPAFYCWALLMLSGFVIVAYFFCNRENPLLSRKGSYDEIFKVLLSIPLLYLLSGALPHRLKEPWKILLYTACFIGSLFFFYLQSIPQINYSLTPQDLQRMHWIGRIVFLCAALLIVFLALYHLRLAKGAGILMPYSLSFFAVLLVLAGVTWAVQDSHYVHIHHYFLFALFIPWARFQTPISLACQALCAGIYVEGVSEWGMAALWYPV